MQGGAALHLAAAEDGRDLGERLGVVVRVEEREAAREEAQEDDAGRPDVERCEREREREGEEGQDLALGPREGDDDDDDEDAPTV